MEKIVKMGTYQKFALAALSATLIIGCEEKKDDEGGSTEPSIATGMSCDVSGAGTGHYLATGSNAPAGHRGAFIQGMKGTSVRSVTLHLSLAPDSSCSSTATASLDLAAYSDAYSTMVQTVAANSVSLQKGSKTAVTFTYSALPVTPTLAFKMAITSISDNDCRIDAASIQASSTCTLRVDDDSTAPLASTYHSFAGEIVAD